MGSNRGCKIIAATGGIWIERGWWRVVGKKKLAFGRVVGTVGIRQLGIGRLMGIGRQ